MSRFTLDPNVRKDLEDIWDYVDIRNASPDAAVRLMETLYDMFAMLARNPLMGEARDDLAEGLRAFVARPYVILYRPNRDGIEVAQVVHSARDITVALRRKKHSD